MRQNVGKKEDYTYKSDKLLFMIYEKEPMQTAGLVPLAMPNSVSEKINLCLMLPDQAVYSFCSVLAMVLSLQIISVSP